MEVKKTVYKKLMKQIDNLNGVSHALEYLADSFYTTGNEAMSDKLSKLSTQITTNTDAIKTDYNKDLDEKWIAQQKETGNILSMLVDKKR